MTRHGVAAGGFGTEGRAATHARSLRRYLDSRIKVYRNPQHDRQERTKYPYYFPIVASLKYSTQDLRCNRDLHPSLLFLERIKDCCRECCRGVLGKLLSLRIRFGVSQGPRSDQ
jgi:hypothetical protein